MRIVRRAPGDPADLDLGPVGPSDEPEIARICSLLEVRLGVAAVRPLDRIDRYVVLDCIGTGTLGIVYHAHDAARDRPIALELLHAEHDSPAQRQRLAQEAKAVAALTSPHVVRVFGSGTDAERFFVAAELVRGRTLRAWCLAQHPPWRALVAAHAQAARGLAALHDAGLVHRDFTPERALVDPSGHVKVLALGLPHASSSAPYLAPELRTGGVADARSDQFSLCTALAEALDGVADVPHAVRSAIVRGLAIDPTARWSSMHELALALERAAA